MMRLPGLHALPLLIPRRACALCAAPHDVLHMTLAGRSWVCRACLARRPDAAAPSRAALAERERHVARLRRVEAAVHYGGLAARVAAYVALGVLAYRSALWTQLFTGVLIADVVGRTVTAFFEARLHRFGLLLEVALYVVLSQVWLGAGGSLALPEDMEGKAVTMLGFLAVFSMRSGMLVWKLMYGEERL